MTDQQPGRATPWGMQVWTSPGPVQAQPVRIGDVERDEALARLGDHFAAGRLTREEFDERSEKALGARFDRDLEPLFGDLPDPRRDAPVRRPRPQVSTVLPILGLLVVMAVVFSVASHGAVLVFPVFWLLLLSGMGRRYRHR